MPLAATATAWIQVVGTLIAATAAVASWVAVGQARKGAEDAREDAREAALPTLLISTTFLTPGAGSPTLGVEVHNAGGGIAQDVSVLIVTPDAYALHAESFLRPGDSVYYGSDLDATPGSRAVVYGRTADRREFVWGADYTPRSELPKGDSKPSWETIFKAIYDEVPDVAALRRGQLLRG